MHERRFVSTGTPPGSERPRNLAGISLSGGGIRSATFNLGMLQALKNRGLLQHFDYLSTVSGGGYCGGWWSAWLSRASRQRKDFFPDDERIEPERHQERYEDALEAQSRDALRYRTDKSESAMNAGVDPVHHLRLFSNFLTPRKGLLSSDTWRAISTIGRNLVLTWLVLLPLMLAAIMCGQAYFALLTENEYEYEINAAGTGEQNVRTEAESVDAADAVVEEKEEDQVAAEANEMEVGERTSSYRERLQRRLVLALAPSAFLMVGAIVCVIVWMLATRKCWMLRDVVVYVLSAIAFTALSIIGLQAVDVKLQPELAWPVIGVFLFFVLILAIAGFRRRRTFSARISDLDFWRNHIAGVQTRYVQWSVFSAVVLLFAGFGHEVIDFLLLDAGFHKWVGAKVVKAGGWGAIAMAGLGSIYTALKASPSGGDEVKTSRPSTVDRIVFAIVPPLLMLVLGLFLAWAGHRWYTEVYEDAHGEIRSITIATVISAFLFIALALYEFRPRSPKRMLLLIGTWLLLAVGVYFLPAARLEQNVFAIASGASVFMLLALAFRGPVGRRNWKAITLAALLGIGTWIVIDWRDYHETANAAPISLLPYMVLIGILFSVALLMYELVWGEGSNIRSFALMTIGFLMFVLLAVASFSPTEYAWRSLAMFGCISTIMGWVLSLGWLADPNTLTVHAFYKARLVRAYMGASNDERRTARDAEITEAVPGDDVPLAALQNTSYGAPYHLVNTTLNLVGARDLATVQRVSDYFVMSKRYCGSFRTGYRRTSEYSCGTVSLGTAVAVSGAAASPSMGAQTPSAALAMLLTLFNVRLGFWAPTPNRGYWRAGSSRLWPVYTIQELLSQTTDLQPFVYLTDGGHFDNTGAYSLIQRGCRFVLIGDCGADPRPSFADVGDLVRKARIDFGTEIEIDLSPLLAKEPTVHHAVGTIRYSTMHAKMLGLSEEERNGIIIVIKPNRAEGASADVLQYGFDNDAFPQQSTGDQWFDEQQFESYRRLGCISADSLFAGEREVKDIAEFFMESGSKAAALQSGGRAAALD
ncbi:MAG TPA: patatin-like phospholipase family protein [Thermoanaerobaculia bacterium]|nr:patatin-like phospholipase family protein [Thermoanaerobaculia bacterium]